MSQAVAATGARHSSPFEVFRVFLRLGALFQKKLELTPGMMDVADVDEGLLVCRKTGGGP